MSASPVEIRTARPSDDAACLDTIRRSFATVAADLGFSEATHGGFPGYWSPERFAEARHTEGELLVAVTGGEVVGCCFVGEHRCEPGRWVLRRLAVVPEARHLGVGARLVAESLAVARANGGARATLRIVADNRILADWYVALGFTCTGRQQPDGLPFEVEDYELAL